MMRLLLWTFTGLVLGGIIHIAVILTLPTFSPTVAWDQVTALTGDSTAPVLLPPPLPGAANPLRLDPELAYAACRLDLRQGPGSISGPLPQAFWSVAVYSRTGTVIYSTTNRDGIGTALDLGVFNQAQTRLLAEQKLDIAQGLLIVETPEDDVIVVVKLAPPHPAMRARYEAALSQLRCGNIAA